MDTGINYLPKWEQFGFNEAFTKHDKQFKETHPSEITKRWERQYKRYAKKNDEFNQYKGRAINKLLSIESKMDCIILGYFAPHSGKLEEQLYHNFFSVSKIEFMNKKSILKNIFNYVFNFPVGKENKKEARFNYPFKLLERLINYRNTLAHSYYEYHIIDSTRKLTGAKITTKAKTGNPDIVFDIEFQREVDDQMWFMGFYLEFIYKLYIKPELPKQSTLRNAVLVMLDCPIDESDVFDITNFKADWLKYFDRIMDSEYGVNKYYKDKRKR